MTDQASQLSSVKLGLAVAWPAFWTGFPVKIVFALLLLAMGLPPWEFPGLGLLLLLSLPVDLWAMGLSAKTVFLERLGLEPPAPLGLTLWWQGLSLTAVYGPIAYMVESQTLAVSQAVVARVMDTEMMKAIPVAERISIELTMWGSVATGVLLLLIVGWLFLFGTIVRRQAALAHPATAPYEARVYRWDLMRVPADQPLLLTVLTATGVLVVLLFWAVLPVTTPHPHESYTQDTKKVGPPLKPVEALQKTEKVLTQAEATVQALEQKAKAGAPKGKGKTKPKS